MQPTHPSAREHTPGETMPESEILEIRVHGVLNTAPAEMLRAQPDEIRRDSGDALGSFWRRKASHQAPPTPGITEIEAFSWGAQARTSGGGLAVIGRAAVHVGWFLLLPYSLANLAYWTRRIDNRTDPAGAATWEGGTGATTVRIFGLLLTLVGVVAFCSVAIDLIAVQCFPDAKHVCAALPAPFELLKDRDRDERAAILGVIPIVVVLVLFLLGRRGRVHFEQRVQKFGFDMGDPGEIGRPFLATRGFWAVSRTAQTTEWSHLAASVALVLLILALDAAYADNDCFRTATTTINAACIAKVWEDPVPAAFAIVALALIVGSIVLVGLASSTRSERATTGKRAWALVCLVLSVTGYLGWTVLTFTSVITIPSDADKHVAGLILIPLALVVIALFLALAGAAWRKSKGWRAASATVLVLGAVMLLVNVLPVTEWFPGDSAAAATWIGWLSFALAALFVLIHVLIAWFTPDDEASQTDTHRFHAWGGRGPAVAMLLGLFAAMALSSLLVLGASSWLSAAAASGKTEQNLREVQQPAVWDIPDAYERFAVVLLAISIAMVVLVGAVLVVNLTRFALLTLPKLTPRPDGYADDEAWAAQSGGILTPETPSLYPERLERPVDLTVRELARTRRTSQLLHRGEPLFGWLAGFAAIGLLALSSNVLFIWLREWASTISPGLPAAVRIVSTSVLAAVALAAVAAVVVQAMSSPDRPLGVFWDVVAFFPRSGHPLAPPCFGERVVPELAARTKKWIDDPAASAPRAVIFSAHSMGSAITAATLFALRGDKIRTGDREGEDVVDHIAMLSFGSQLRGYFSRFFPSVFGHEILGVPGTNGPSLWRSDPWRDQVRDEFEADGLPAPAHDHLDITLTSVLGATPDSVPRWRNLWRRTDYLGFPVYGYRGDGNPVDQGATEDAPNAYVWRVATHGGEDYLDSAQYANARSELIPALQQIPPERASDIAGS